MVYSRRIEKKILYAIKKNRLDIFKLYVNLENSTFTWITKDNSQSIFLYLVGENKPEFVRYLLSLNPELIKLKTERRYNALHIAIKHNLLEMMKVFCDDIYTFLLDECTTSGDSAFLLAAYEKDSKPFNFLIEKFPNYNFLGQSNNKLETAFLISCREGYYDKTAYILEHCNSSMQYDSTEKGYNTLQIILQNMKYCDQDLDGYYKIIKLLISKGIPVIDSPEDNSFLQLADSSNDFEIIKIFTAAHQLMNAAETKNNSILNIKSLLAAGASLNECNILKQTPLHVAALNNNLYVVKDLLENGANANLKDSHGMLPIECAQNNDNWEIIIYFILQSYNKDHHEKTFSEKILRVKEKVEVKYGKETDECSHIFYKTGLMLKAEGIVNSTHTYQFLENVHASSINYMDAQVLLMEMFMSRQLTLKQGMVAAAHSFEPDSSKIEHKERIARAFHHAIGAGNKAARERVYLINDYMDVKGLDKSIMPYTDLYQATEILQFLDRCKLQQDLILKQNIKIKNLELKLTSKINTSNFTNPSTTHLFQIYNKRKPLPSSQHSHKTKHLRIH